MKKAPYLSLLAVILTAGVFAGTNTRAAIIGINTASSSAQILFDDTNSVNPSAIQGITYLPVLQPVWNGTLFTLPTTTDPNTGDSAVASLSATFSALSYAINLVGLQLAQPVPNTGYAVVQVNFNVQFQLDAAGLPSQPTFGLPVAMNGTVSPGGFSSFDGSVTYTSGSLGGIEGANYISFFGAPGPFSSVVFPAFINGTTPALPANDTLTLTGVFVFKVDPATLNADTVPEPTVGALALLSAFTLLVRRRRG